MNTISANGNSNRQFKIVTAGCERLSDDETIREKESEDEKGNEEHDDKVAEQGDGCTTHRTNVVNDFMSLIGKHDNDSIQETEESQRAKGRQEFLIVPFRTL